MLLYHHIMSETGKETAKIKIGEMPKPRYIREGSGTSIDGGYSNISEIGIEAYSPNGEVKTFLWWRNMLVGDLNGKKDRYDAAVYIARLKLGSNTDAAIGLPIDPPGSNPQTGHIQILSEKGIYGLYIETERKPTFAIATMILGVMSELELSIDDPENFNEIIEKALAVLPKLQ